MQKSLKVVFSVEFGELLETFVLGYFTYFCLICSLQTAESLYILSLNLICNGG